MPSEQTDRRSGYLSSVALKAPCKAVTTTAITLNGEQTVGGTACVTGDRVLVAISGGSVNNGIWVVDTGDWSRAKDFNGSRDAVFGTLVLVGPEGPSRFWQVATEGAIYPGTTVIEFVQLDPSAVNTSFRTVKDYGTVAGNGITNDTAALQTLVNMGGEWWLPDGDYLIDGLELSDVPNGATVLKGAAGARLLASGDGVTLIDIPSRGYACQVWGLTLDGNGYANVTGMDMYNMRVNGGVFSCLAQNMETGFISRHGGFGEQLANLATTNVPNPFVVIENASVLAIENPSFDNEPGVGGDGTGTGVDVQYGTGSNLGVRIIGGYIQGFDVGVKDAGIGTLVQGTYFEDCATADIFATTNARNFAYLNTRHFGPDGPCCFKIRSADAGRTEGYVMASGARTVVHDANATATNCEYDEPGSNAFYNVPLDTAADAVSKAYMKKVPKQTQGTFTPVVFGTGSAGAGIYSVQLGEWTRIGDLIQFNITLTWSTHTGTGNMLINGLPIALLPASFSPTRIFELAIDGIPYTGPAIYAYFNGTSSAPDGIQISMVQVSTGGVASLIPIDGSGSIHIEGSYRMT